MKIKKEGIEFEYHGDTITRRWPWFFRSGSKYHSKQYSLYFNEFNVYWIHVGRAEYLFEDKRSKLEGFTYSELIGQWVRQKYPFENIVLLKDVNVEERGLSFWAKIPKDKIEHIQKDVIILRCGSKENACEIVDSIEPNFAEAFAFSGGVLINYN
jgi:hypothetical protein